VLRWLGRHPWFVFHFTPTSCSWLNAVETFFSRLIRSRLRRGVFRSIVGLQAAVGHFIEEHNAAPKPFVCTANPEMILGKVARGTHAFALLHWGVAKHAPAIAPVITGALPRDPERADCANTARNTIAVVILAATSGGLTPILSPGRITDFHPHDTPCITMRPS
jgi:hypothetical protein